MSNAISTENKEIGLSVKRWQELQKRNSVEERGSEVLGSGEGRGCFK